VDELLDDAILGQAQGVAVLAATELSGRAGLLKAKSRALARGLPRVAMLSGSAGAFSLAAFGGFSEHSILLSGVSFLLGIVGSSVTLLVTKRGRKAALRLVEVASAVGRQVAVRFGDESTSPRGQGIEG
jgi:hypothetical protein